MRIQALIVFMAVTVFSAIMYPLQAAEVNQEAAQVYFGLGKVSFDGGALEMAIDDFTKAIKYDSSFAEAYLLRGVSYGKMDKISEAIADFSKASELRTDFAEAYYNRGLAYCKVDEFVKAIADFTKAIALQVDFDEAYNMRAFAFYQNENYDGAWNDIHILEQMGYKISPEFMDNLRKVSGRKK